MRMLIGGLVFIAVATTACGGSADKTADATADSAAMAAAAPAGLMAADVTGTWTGVTYAEVGDSVTNRWTIMSATGDAGQFIMDGSTDTVSYTAVYDADSAVAISSPYTDPTLPAGSPQMMWRSVGRMVGGKFVGTSAVMAVSAPDSVVGRGRWEATRAP